MKYTSVVKMAKPNNIISLEKVLCRLKLEESKLHMNNSVNVFEKSILIYFLFLAVGVIGFINNFASLNMLYAIVLSGMVVLFIGLIPYIKSTNEHSLFLENMIHSFEKQKNTKKVKSSK